MTETELFPLPGKYRKAGSVYRFRCLYCETTEDVDVERRGDAPVAIWEAGWMNPGCKGYICQACYREYDRAQLFFYRVARSQDQLVYWTERFMRETTEKV